MPPTVAASYLGHHDQRSASPACFLLDAGELCSHSFLPMSGPLDKGISPLPLPLPADSLGADTDHLLLSSLAAFTDDALSPGASSAAMQFLLLDDEDMVSEALPPLPADMGAAHALAAPVATVPDMLRQFSDYSSDVTRTSVPCDDTSALYCLAVVDEVTGLPLRPATPEETWEVERCFVLHHESELLGVVLPQELPALDQQQQGYEQPSEMVAQRAGSEAAGSAGAAESMAGAISVADGFSCQQTEQDEGRAGGRVVQEADAQEQCQEEEEAVPTARPPPRRHDQPRRCGPCDNCGVTESPQWRQGPPAKPLLCNACGMRFRRTNQLVAGETGASGIRGGARAYNKKPACAPAAPAPAAAAAEQRQRPKASKVMVAPPLVGPDAKRPRRAAAVAAAATFAAAIDVV